MKDRSLERMMNIRYGLICIGCLFFSGLWAGESYCFRVYLKDKGETEYSVDYPEAYLSSAAVERRIRQGLVVTEEDIPISYTCFNNLKAVGVTPVVHSKWFSTIVVAAKDSTVADQLCSLPMVDSVKWVWKGEELQPGDLRTEFSSLSPREIPGDKLYGYAERQIKMLNGVKLHEQGFRGQGMTVAVIDAGFRNVDRITAFDSLQIVGTYNAVSPGESVFEGDDHGTKVLSCMAAGLSGIMVGTAPEASYWLIKSEDSRSEYPIEEDYWMAAVEFADSVGVDVISSSLGYFHFDERELNYNQEQLDGKTVLISRAAEKAAARGILVVCSAGNEGSSSWEKITFPSDAMDILTVGAITNNKEKSVFSSTGFTADYRVKPDVVALGSGCAVIDGSGNIRYANGTSFSTPIVAGLALCLWQALPWLSNREIVSLLQSNSTQYKKPDAELGYGIPDVYKAYREGRKQMSRNR